MNPLRRAIARIVLEDLDPYGRAMSVLRKADLADYHMLPLDGMTDQEREQADRLVARGLLRRLPADGRFPDRYVVTGGGSHALGTFRGADMWADFEGQPIQRRRRRPHGSSASLGKPASAIATVGEGRDAFEDEMAASEGEAARGPEWLASQRAKLEGMTFEQLLRLVRWNDPNGAWSDRELAEYGTDHGMLVDQLMEWIKDGMESPDEWIAGSRRPF